MRIRIYFGVLLIFISINGPVLLAACYASCIMDFSRESNYFPIPRGVVDIENAIGWIANQNAGIDGIDINTGKKVVTTQLASQPLVIIGHCLIALKSVADQTNALEFILLNTRDSEPVIVQTKIVEFPDWVLTSTASGSQFRYYILPGSDSIIFKWEASSRYRGGAYPSAQIKKKFTNDAQGDIKIDLKSDNMTIERSVSHTDEYSTDQLSNPYLRDDRWHSKPWRVGNKSAKLVVNQQGHDQVLSLNVSDLTDSANLQSIELIQANATTSLVTSDGRHIFVREDSSQSLSATGKHNWKVFSLEKAKEISNVSISEDARMLSIVGNQLYYLIDKPESESAVSITLESIDISSNKLIWSYPLQTRQLNLPPKLPG